jgi:hypothetical protein
VYRVAGRLSRVTIVLGMEHEWDEDGFVVLRGAAPGEALAAYDGELDAVRDRLLVRAPGDEHPSLAVRREASPAGAVDPYALAPAARALLLPDAVIAFLSEVFGTAPLLIDAAETAAGAPDPAAYRDTTYIAASDPDRLTGLAVAQADDVTVAVYAGSHRLAPDLFSGRYHHHNPERDGADALAAHRERLVAALAEGGFARQELRLAAGDVLVWRGGLAHEPVAGRALVGHVLPAHAQPGWFAYRPQRTGRAPYGAAWLASQHYDLDGATDAAPPTPAETPGIDQVEDALERHDAPPGQEPPRRGGLVGTVRGLMGRRGSGGR